MNNEFFGVNGNKKLFKEDILNKGIKKGSRILYTKCIKKNLIKLWRNEISFKQTFSSDDQYSFTFYYINHEILTDRCNCLCTRVFSHRFHPWWSSSTCGKWIMNEQTGVNERPQRKVSLEIGKSPVGMYFPFCIEFICNVHAN